LRLEEVRLEAEVPSSRFQARARLFGSVPILDRFVPEEYRKSTGRVPEDFGLTGTSRGARKRDLTFVWDRPYEIRHPLRAAHSTGIYR
jgi:hypothetical protein